jgi:hypothetical protein
LSRAPQRFRQGDVAKIIKAAAAAGREVASITVDREGRIQVQLVTCKAQPGTADCKNEWDTVLK